MLRVLTEHVHNRLQKNKGYIWIGTYETDDDLKAIKEAASPSEFDPLRLRQGLFEALQEGQATLQSRILVQRGKKESPLAKVIVICEKGKEPKVNWILWANIFRAFGTPAAGCTGNMWRVLFFCARSPRLFPLALPGQKLGPANINGGYAYPNVGPAIVIYREEEAARVLVHELLHACGSDNMEHPEWKREVLTESWAELFLIALQAGGSVSKGEALWMEQARWIMAQELLLTQIYGVRTASDYAFRYTVGRRTVMERWGLRFPKIDNPREIVGESLRFSAPVLSGE